MSVFDMLSAVQSQLCRRSWEACRGPSRPQVMAMMLCDLRPPLDPKYRVPAQFEEDANCKDMLLSSSTFISSTGLSNSDGSVPICLTMELCVDFDCYAARGCKRTYMDSMLQEYVYYW
jgi:hypothetical protein